MNRLKQCVRTILRYSLALFLWLHAVFFFDAPLRWVARIASRLNVSIGELVVLSIIIFTTALASYGWASFLFDILWIYTFPFILLFKLAYAPLKGQLRAMAAANQSTVKTTLVVSPEQSQDGISLRQRLFKPATKFVFLWCILLLFTHRRPLLTVSVFILSLRLAYDIFRTTQFFIRSVSMLTTLEKQIEQYALGLIDKILNFQTRQNEVENEIKQTYFAIKAMRFATGLLKSKEKAGAVGIALAVTLTVILHLYFSFIFAFLYFGISKLYGGGFALADSFIDAVFIPMSYADLPHFRLIHVLAGLQYIMVAGLIFGTISAYLKGRFESLVIAVGEMDSKIQTMEVQEKMTSVAKIVEVRLTAPPTAQPQE